MRPLFHRDQPAIPPTNVRFEREDGTIIPLQLVRGPNVDGIQIWIAWAPDGVEVAGECHVLIDRLPGRTTIGFYFERLPDRIVFLGPPPTEPEMTS